MIDFGVPGGDPSAPEKNEDGRSAPGSSPTSSPLLSQFQTFLSDEVIFPLPIGCAVQSVTGSHAAVLAFFVPLPSLPAP
ncbi:hypothetical protein P7K49_002483 [Saguinus oedipus]|uniref:Uncharacterized protein n=1 Tax=Saguinus oedipus TaxID=9490 RepID=A0ABQ9WHH2_SAGOE|nr:hypothetical protein P7K49_002483 [Saguinus oedipus]